MLALVLSHILARSKSKVKMFSTYDLSLPSALVAVSVFGALLSSPLYLARGILMVWPGVVAHELAHWIVALLTGCRPGMPNLWAKRNSDGSVTLGHVIFEARFFFSAWVGLAPLLILGPAALFLVFTPINASFTVAICNGVLSGYLAWGALPSSQDLKVALQDPAGLIAIILLGWAVHMAVPYA